MQITPQYQGMSNDREQAAFEAGIKLGALYHQWVGTPIAVQTASGVEAVIEQSVGLQPFVQQIDVTLDRSLMNANAFGYTELSGLMFDVTIRTKVGATTCVAALKPEDGYPLMRIVNCDEEKLLSDH